MIIQIENDQHWHQLRAKHIGASEVGALANLSPWATAYTLYNVKTGLADEIMVSDDVQNGLDFEAAIATRYAIDNQLNLVKVKSYAQCDDEPFLGATLDYDFTSFENKPIIVEVKHVISASWHHHQWSPDLDYMPPHIEMQIVAQMMCTGIEEGRVVAFCDGNYYHWTRKRGEERVEKMVLSILELVRDMKRRIEERDAPDAFGKPVELSMMGLVAPVDKEKPTVDLTDDAKADALLHHYSQATEAKTIAEKEIDRCKAEMTQLFQRASNQPEVSPDLMTQHYTLRRIVIDVKERTQTVKTHQQVRFTVKVREDVPTLNEPSNPIMAG